LLTGCCCPTHPAIDSVVCDLAITPRDATLVGRPIAVTGYSPEELARMRDPKATLIDRLVIPQDLPGADIQKLDLPAPVKGNEEKRAEALRSLYPKLPEVGAETVPVPGPDGQPLTLGYLQTLALTNSPLIRQAVARVESARGVAEQAGLPPNPTLGYVANTIGTGGTAGQMGPFFDQVIKLGNKLQLTRAVAAMDLRIAQIALKKAEMDLLTSVRRTFFKVLVAQESVRVLRALELMAAQVHTLQAEQLVKGGDVAPYEPLQTRVQVAQAQAALVQARHQMLGAWKQLAANVGLPGMPLTEIAGNLSDMPLPVYEHETVLAHVLRTHTDLMTAEAGILKARHAIALAKTLNVPDMDVNVQITPDFSTPKNPLTPTVQVGFTGLPFWHRNHGAIAQAESDLIAADEAMPASRNDLTGRVAEAFSRYAAGRTQVALLRDGALPDQIRAYRAIRDRYIKDPSTPDSSAPNFQDVVNAQQNVIQLLAAYLGALDAFATALIDVADLIQTDDLYLMASGRACLGPIGLSLVEECRPCSPVTSKAFRVPSAVWPVNTPGLLPRPHPNPASLAPSAPTEEKHPEKEEKKPEPELAPPPRPTRLPDLPDLPGAPLPPIGSGK
jgi:cobalt-zinc-cadmium efflux system outer membrane protein